jgi:hypothetical protein
MDILDKLWLHRKKVATFVALLVVALWKGCTL